MNQTDPIFTRGAKVSSLWGGWFGRFSWHLSDCEFGSMTILIFTVMKRLVSLGVWVALALAGSGSALAQWVPTNGIYGGGIESLVSDNLSLFATVEGVGVYRSSDLGLHWSSAANIPFNNSTGCWLEGSSEFLIASTWYGVYLSFDDGLTWPRTCYLQHYCNKFSHIGTCLIAGTEEGIQRSTDSGLTWEIPKTGGNMMLVTALAVVDTILFCGTDNNGVWRSRDRGQNWSVLDTAQTGRGVTSLSSMGKILFAGEYASIARSTDYGSTWMKSTKGLPNGYPVSRLVALGTKLFAGIDGAGMYLSTDSGKSWTHSHRGMSDGGISSLTVKDNFVFAGCEGVYRSSDTGKSWLSESLGLESLSSDAFLADSGSLYAAGGLLYRTTNNGDLWTPEGNDTLRMDSVSAPYSLSSITCLAKLGSLIYAGSFGVYSTSDGGNSWDLRSHGLPPRDYIQCLIVNGSNLFAGTQDFGMFRSTDGGVHWCGADSGLPAKARVMSLCSVGNIIIAGLQDSSVYLSTDEGVTWTGHHVGLNRYMYYVFAIDTIIFAADDGGDLFRSSLKDTSWTIVSPPMKNSGGSKTPNFAVIDSTLFIGIQSGIFMSFDNGDNWIEVDSGLTNAYTDALTIADGYLFASTGASPSIWRRPLSEITPSPYAIGTTTDTLNFGNIQSGKQALRIATVSNNGKSPLTIRSFPLTPAQGAFVTSDLSSAVTLNPGEFYTFEVYFRPTTARVYSGNIGIVSEAKRINITLIGTADGAGAVEQQMSDQFTPTLFPNPVSQSSQITFTPATPTHADISILNLLGTEVNHLFSGELEASEHTFQWNPNPTLPDGMYECLIRMNDRAERLPMMLMR